MTSSAKVILNRPQVRSQTNAPSVGMLYVNETKAVESLRSVLKLEYEGKEGTEDVWVRLTGSIIAFCDRTVRRARRHFT